MKLSIITICFNEKEIRRTCESIVNQSWQDFEWIVIDGGSTDGTVDILNQYKSRINVFISEKDNGIYNAMNKGIKLAHGEWLNFMNGGDCFYDNDVLRKTFGNNKNYDASVLYGFTYTPEKKKFRKPSRKVDSTFFIGSNINHQSTFIKKSLFDKYGLYDETMKIAADFDKWCQFSAHGEKFACLDFCVAQNDLKGISSNPTYANLNKKEHDLAISRNYSPQQIKKYWRKKNRSLKNIGQILAAYILFPWYVFRLYQVLVKNKN